MERQFKYGMPCQFELKDLDLKERIIKAYYFNAETVDADNDIIDIGAYDKSIAERGPKSAEPRIKHLFNHWEGAGKILELGKDEKGGWFLSKLGRHTVGRDTLLMYEDGLITEHSHGFETINSQVETREGHEIRLIKEGILWEVSSLDKWGANMHTPVIKSLEDRTYWEKRIEKLIKALDKGKYTDETFDLLEYQLKQVQEVLKQSKPCMNCKIESKPYENEHAARIREPGDFEKDSFRRKNISKGIDIIIGKLKGEDTMTTQAYRFDAKEFTAEEAKKWLKDHDIKYISFEAAKEEPKQLSTRIWAGSQFTLKRSYNNIIVTI